MSEEQITPEDIEDAKEMLGSGYEHHIRDESGDRKYFVITPRIVKAFSRDPYDLALWDTVKDVAGESGECFLNTEQLALLSGMSTGKVSSSRAYWISIGFLQGEKRQDPGFTQPVWHLTIPDLWQKNIEWCEKNPKIADRIAFKKAQKSLHHMKPSPHEGKPSPHERKKNNQEEPPRARKKSGKGIDPLWDALHGEGLEETPEARAARELQELYVSVAERLEVGLRRGEFPQNPKAQTVYRWIAGKEKMGESLDVWMAWAMRDPHAQSLTWVYHKDPALIKRDWPQAFIPVEDNGDQPQKTYRVA